MREVMIAGLWVHRFRDVCDARGRRLRRRGVLTLGLPLVLLAWSAGVSAQVAVLDRDPLGPEPVDRAVQALQQYLVAAQREDGSFDSRIRGGRFHGGGTALVTLALLESGFSTQDPAIVAAVDFLRSLDTDQTYVRSLRLQVLAKMPDAYLPDLRREVVWFTQSHHEGTFDYRSATRIGDHSNTHFGVLALAAAEQRGVAPPRGVWVAVVAHLLAAQNEDGGWGYRVGSASTPSMTAAGLTALLAARSAMHPTLNQPPRELQAAIDDAYARINAQWGASVQRSELFGNRRDLYGLIALERCLLWDGRVRLRTPDGDRDWYRRDARALLATQGADGSVGGRVVPSAMALIYLSRGRHPVWASKLELPGRDWNRRPNDLNHFTRRLSDWREVPLSWQTVSVRSEPLTWLNTPIVYLSVDAPPALDTYELANVRRYIDLGGLLVVNVERGASDETIAALRETVTQLFPGTTLEPMASDHPARTLITPPDEDREGAVPLTAHNGARDLVVVLPDDWGRRLQAGRGLAFDQAADAMINLYTFATDRGVDLARLDSPLHEPPTPAPTRRIDVVRGLPGGQRPVEWLAWVPFASRFQRANGRRVTVQWQPVQSVYGSGADLLHLAGVEPVELTDSEVQSIVRFAREGGTVLIESLGGGSDFARKLSRRLRAELGPARELTTRHPLVSGDGDDAPAGLRDVSRVVYTRYTTLTYPFGDTPRLRAHEVDGRAAVIVCDLDLSLAALRIRRYGVHGFSPESAEDILTNVLLYAEWRRGAVPHAIGAP